MLVFDELLSVDPSFLKGYNNKGTIYFNQKNFQEAYTLFKRALEINPNYETARINIGITLNEMGKSEEAVKEFEMYSLFSCLRIATTGQIKSNPEALIAYGTALRNI